MSARETSTASLEPQDEDVLLEAASRGDRLAAERLVAATYAQTFAALVKMTGGRRETAADLTQETYRRAWQAFGSFDRRSRFATWLYRIAYTTFLNHIRRPKPVEPLDEAQAARLPASGESQEERVSRLHEAARLRRAVLALPEELRFTVTARYWAEMEVKDIASLEKVTGAAIRKRLKVAKTLLRAALEEDVA